MHLEKQQAALREDFFPRVGDLRRAHHDIQTSFVAVVVLTTGQAHVKETKKNNNNCCMKETPENMDTPIN